ncbi:hypothetical protein B0H34DRAFT_251593 [Crassisporium funariophilum]|nr:hypothetical protein B0H34DRAFT_251593 [Crassisporium funariophilum]
MPPRPPKVFHVQVKTHKLTIMLSGLAPGTSIAELKSETLSALQADVATDALDVMAMDPPEIIVESEHDFELCRAIKERGRPTGALEVIEPSKLLRECGLTGWEALFLQVRDRDTGDLLPVTYTLPPMYDEDDEQPQAARPPDAEDTNKLKRKASEDLEETIDTFNTDPEGVLIQVP